MSSSIREMHKVSSFVTKKLLSGDAECSLRIQPFHLATRNVPSGEERGETAAMYSQATLSAAMKCSKCLLVRPRAQGPEEMCLSLEHQNPSKTSEKISYFDRVTVSSLHILYTANQETEGSQDWHFVPRSPF